MSNSEGREGGLTRKQLLGTGAGAAAAALLAQGAGVERALAAAKGGRKDVAGMNIILILTDQERAIQHFPKNWLRQNLPRCGNAARLSSNAPHQRLAARRRSTLMSCFPAQHGVKYTLERRGTADPRWACPGTKNLATVMKASLQRRLQGQMALLETGQKRRC